MAEKKRKKRKHFSKLMQKKLVGSFALVLFVLLGLNLRIVYITAKNGDNYAKQVLSQKQYDSRTIPYAERSRTAMEMCLQKVKRSIMSFSTV